jgi:hypothetical protein
MHLFLITIMNKRLVSNDSKMYAYKYVNTTQVATSFPFLAIDLFSTQFKVFVLFKASHASNPL